MEKLAAITTSLFIAANAMAVVSLLRPEWIVNKVNGERIFHSLSGLCELCELYQDNLLYKQSYDVECNLITSKR